MSNGLSVEINRRNYVTSECILWELNMLKLFRGDVPESIESDDYSISWHSSVRWFFRTIMEELREDFDSEEERNE